MDEANALSETYASTVVGAIRQFIDRVFVDGIERAVGKTSFVTKLWMIIASLLSLAVVMLILVRKCFFCGLF